MSTSETSSKVHEPQLYKKAINDPIHGLAVERNARNDEPNILATYITHPRI